MPTALPKLPYYEAVEQIGHGGTSLVYSAIDLRTGFPVAIKMLFRHAFRNESMRQRFQEEANRYLYLNHPGIVKLSDFIAREDGCFLVMEYLSGQTIEEYINTVTGPIAGEVAVGMLREVCQALQFAHDEHVIHLDIKPSNIMITDKGEIKVVDFGIAHELTQKQSDKIVGSPMYMAPEQLNGDKLDHRTDIYALGATLFQMVTGCPPYQGISDRDKLFKAIRNKAFPTTDTFYPHVETEIQAVIEKATRKLRARRYQSCHAFMNDLDRIYA